MKLFVAISGLILSASWTLPLEAWPVSFSNRGRGIDISHIEKKSFRVFFDKDCKTDADWALTSLVAAEPHLSKWFGRSRSRPLNVHLSPKSKRLRGASFANFLLDSLEIQTSCEGHRDLHWHELVHETMYRHLYGRLGPATSIFHLIWIPSWFVEGLAEVLAATMHLDEQKVFGKMMSRPTMESAHSWPSYERLHAIYKEYSYHGYAISVLFVGYIFEQLKAVNKDDLPGLIEEIYLASLPYRWPGAILPFADTLPLDRALSKRLGKNGRQLYADFVAHQVATHRSSDAPPASTENSAPAAPVQDSMPIHTFVSPRGESYFTFKNGSGEIIRREGERKAFVGSTNGPIWVESFRGRDQICRFAHGVQCFAQTMHPKSIEALAELDSTGVVFLERDQRLDGDRFMIKKSDDQPLFAWPPEKEARALMSKGKELIVLSATQTGQSLYFFSESFDCLGEQTLPAPSLGLNDTTSKDAVFIYQARPQGFHWQRIKLQPQHKPCQLDPEERTHDSPLLQAERARHIPQEIKPVTYPESPAPRGGQFVFLLPFAWSDSEGTQAVVFGLPWISHSQEHEIRTYLGYGLQSRYPNTQLSYLNRSTFIPLEVSAYRTQIWDGLYPYKDPAPGSERVFFKNGYVDAAGVSIGGTYTSFVWPSLRVRGGVTLQSLKPFEDKNPFVRLGLERTVNLSVSWSKGKATQTSFYLGTNMAPKALNPAFDYQKYTIKNSIHHSFPWRGLRLGVSLLGQLTRGAARRNLQEVYRSVEIFSPGTGQNAFEQLFFPILDQGGSFALAYGDSKADATLSMDLPVWTNIDHLIRIAYVDRMVLKSRLKHGGAWSGNYFPIPQKRMRTSQVHELSFEIDLKGYGVYPGVGAAQVLGGKWDAFASISLDAVF